jgi:hypothetical protein
MDAPEKYRQLALQCLSLAEGLRDPACRAEMVRLAQAWAKLAERGSEAALPRTSLPK